MLAAGEELRTRMNEARVALTRRGQHYDDIVNIFKSLDFDVTVRGNYESAKLNVLL